MDIGRAPRGSAQGFEIGGDVGGLSGRQARRRHGVAGDIALGVVDPGGEIGRRIVQHAGDENAASHLHQRWADQPVGALDAGNRVAAAAAFLLD